MPSQERGFLLSKVVFFKGDMSKFSSVAALLRKSPFLASQHWKRFQLSLLEMAMSIQNTWHVDTSSDDEKAREDCLAKRGRKPGSLNIAEPLNSLHPEMPVYSSCYIR